MVALNDVCWLLDQIEGRRTFNAVVDAIGDLKSDGVNDASSAEIKEAIERYGDLGVDLPYAQLAIERFYARIHELGANISMVMQTSRGSAPYIPWDKLR